MSGLLAKTLRSWTFNLALMWIATFGAIVVILFAYVHHVTWAYVMSRSDRAIAGRHAALHRVYETGGRGELIATIEQSIAEQRLEGGFYLLSDPSFAPVAGNLTMWPPALKTGGLNSFSDPRSGAGAAGRPVLRAESETLPDGYHLLVGRDISDLEDFAKNINAAFALVLSLLVVLAGSAGVLVTRRTVGRIEAINATTRAIMQGGLGKRIPVQGTRDEWDQLTENLNSMLARIECLMYEVKEVTDSVAHDLRTPLTRMRGRLEQACTRARNADEDQLLIGDTLADLDGVLRMFSSLLRISQIEAVDRSTELRPVDLTKVASEVIELFDAASEESGGCMSLVADEQVWVAGDRDLLFDAISNLVDNALKHGREAGRISIEVGRVSREPFISVSDDGPGIPLNERQRVLKHFYRLERSRGRPGNGLGLSVVDAVARLHGASIEMLDNLPGLKVRLQFPWLEARHHVTAEAPPALTAQ
jgi:signal transduction histidine kinase